ncbi:ATP-dependent helicase [Pseudomonas sp. LTJR-52]|uniref:UvrD-helicase domain-containing protein n=1 Tax=Pseudomonas sp. LTJR-52 TaxID=2479392 RepID=UPI000EFB50A3|nr:ATP-dependent helicase [Pseudomonas sp. LTJR-52]AYN93432.1 ATP-dependent helicase [Pseudomonas sp. LTJR-52]
MFNFTEEQKEAIKPQGCMVITACPGSGKTAVVSEKIRNELKQLKDYQGVIAITFTRKASQELEHRCRIGGLEIKSSFFGTIDSFCLREIILPFWKHVFEHLGEDLEPKQDADLSIDERILVDENKDVNNISEANFLELIETFSKNNIIYFPTITRLAIHILKSSISCKNYIKSKYKSIYIDEYQDSSEQQHIFFNKVVDLGVTGIAVGDLNQSIYGWRGSSPEYLKELMRSPLFTHRTVTINHRCHPSIYNYANRILNPTFETLPCKSINVYHHDIVGTQRELILCLNKLIPLILKKRPKLTRSDLAVLVKNNNTLEHIREHLTVPCRVFSKDSIDNLESKNGQLWSDLLRFRYNQEILPEQIISALPLTSTLKRPEIKRLRNLIKEIRTTPENTLVDKLISFGNDIFGKPTDTEIAALKLTVEDREAIKQYYPSSPDEIQCMTIHKSKGLEFDVVIHLDLYEWILPRLEINENSREPFCPNLEQDLNLHYVALTRAKSICVLMWSTQRINSRGKQVKGEPSRFLKRPGINGLYKTLNT